MTNAQSKTRTQSKGRDKAGAARSAARKKKGPKHPNKEGFSNKSVDDDDGGELTNGTNVTDEEQKMLARLKHDNAIREERNKYKEAERQKFWIHRPIVNGLTILHVFLAIWDSTKTKMINQVVKMIATLDPTLLPTRLRVLVVNWDSTKI